MPQHGNWIVGLAGLLLAACTSTQAPTAPVPAAGPTATAAAALSCAEIEGLDPVLTPTAVLLIGEMHGTRESPAFVEEVVCTALARRLSVTVALEIPHQEATRIDAFLASDGGAAARRALLVGPFWDGEFQDGRRSVAKLELLDRLRGWRQQGLPVEVALIDQEERTSGPERDARMAERLAAAARAADAGPDAADAADAAGGPVVVLTGNLHTRTVVGTPWDPSYELMGYLVERALPERSVVALDVASDGGTAWFCSAAEPESCRVQQVRTAPAEGEGLRVILDGRAAERGYDGFYSVGGALTASPPAVRESPAAVSGAGGG